MVDPRGWTTADFANAYASGTRVATVIEATLVLLRAAPPGVLIGEPLASSALADADRLDRLDPVSLPLFGVPFLVKDNIDVNGVPTTAGCPGFSFVPAGDATVVALLRAAGAIVVGKSNLDQFATGLVGTRSPFGTPPNTVDERLVPGGSSSGSAVAVAAGLVPFALGTDTAGSGRVPAALNGIIGFKPTLGRASTHGILPAVRRIDCPSVFARCVDDAAKVARLICRPDPLDPFMRPAKQRRPFRPRPVVGIPRAWPESIQLSAEMACWYAAALERLDVIGCDFEPVDIAPLIEIGSMLYGSALVAERSASVGHAVENGVEGLDPVVASIVARGHEYSAIDAYRAEYELTRLRSAATAMWDSIDVLALPTTATVVSLTDVAEDPFGANELMGRLTTFVNLVDLMSIVVPTDAGVTAGLQLIGRAWHDDDVIRLASGVESGVLLAAAEQSCTLVVVGAHLSGLALNHQLTDRRATLVMSARTAADYRLFALAGTVPPKPGLLRVEPGTGAEIEVEVWTLGFSEFGSFVDDVPAPLCIGTVVLADGSSHNGFLCEPVGLGDAVDITGFGGWRAYLASR